MPANRWWSRWRWWLVAAWLVIALGPVLPMLVVLVVVKTWPLAALLAVALLVIVFFRLVRAWWRR